MAGAQGGRKLLALDPRPDGIFCYTDAVAMGAMVACLEGAAIPKIFARGLRQSHYDDFLRVR